MCVNVRGGVQLGREERGKRGGGGGGGGGGGREGGAYPTKRKGWENALT